MNAKQKPGGRPRLTQGSRSKKLDVRFTDDEYKIILQLEQTLGVSKADLVRIRVLQNAPAVIVNAKELITAIDTIGAQLGRCGNNINQFARYVNILQKQDKADAAVTGRFNLLFAEFINGQGQLEVSLRRIIRLLMRPGSGDNRTR